jgi:uncharacterized membrane protein YphA (DoxX/SURF4 family)
MKRNFIVGIVSLLLILLFVYTSLAKLTDYYNFKFGLSESPFIAPFANILSWAVPASELGIAALLAIPKFRLAGLYASFVLMSLFTLYIASMLGFGEDIPCSCGGVIEEMSWPMHIVFNSAFVLLSGIAIWIERRKRRQMVQVVLPI